MITKANGDTTALATTTPEIGGGARLIDDFLRQTLRVGDPRNPEEIAKALRTKYKGEATKLDEEARGLPVPLGKPVIDLESDSRTQTSTPGNKSCEEARQHLDADLTALLKDPAARDWIPELMGWRDSLIRELNDGADAARYAQDAARREQALLSIRRLSDYARVARFVGTVSPEVSDSYRRLARSLDSGSWSLRILIGEGLYGAGLIEGGIILQVSVVDARIRRDAVIASIRALTGVVAEQPVEDWGRGPASYRNLLQELLDNCSPELRVYLRESTLARSLDGLLAAAQRKDPSALRGLASTAPVELAQLRRLYRQAKQIAFDRSSSPLASFVQTLKLFLDAFEGARAGARFIDLGVPLPIAVDQASGGDRYFRDKLRYLIGWRSDFAREIDCAASCCECTPQTRRALVVLDAALNLTDRAIDVLAEGEGKDNASNGPEEKRAAALMFLVRGADRFLPAPGGADDPFARVHQLIHGLIDPVLRPPPLPGTQEFDKEAYDLNEREVAWADLVRSLAPRCALLE